jgi:DNA (cytosine-5)-methyltransferase 1
MADGSHSFNFPPPQHSRLRPGEIIVDLFAGGGGASEALKQALGRDPDLAYNHDAWAIGMHAANHPLTSHHREDIWHADPRIDVAGRQVGWFHASPDCTHFSQAKGGQPRSGKIRSLTWVILKWVGQLRRADQINCTSTAPRIISLENVWQILTWGPLVAKRDRTTGRVLKLDGSVAGRGERVPRNMQQLVPDKRHAGRTWRKFVAALRGMGYAAEWRKLTASDYGAGTSRARLFLVARRDGEPIRWPAPTHGKEPGLLPLVTAADCIDWSIPCPSIFARRKPLADATLRRIAKGVHRYVLDTAEPFIVCGGGLQGHCVPTLVACANASASGVTAADAPLGTITAWPRGGSTALVTAFIEQANGGFYNGAGNDLRRPMPTICGTGSQQRLVAGYLAAAEAPEHEATALRVAAFLTTYYGTGGAVKLTDPLDTITTRDRLALVTVTIKGMPYVIIDIGLRMLKPHELYRAQGFPTGYVIDRTADGRRLTTSASVRMVGNSVSPPPLRAIATANLDTAQMQLAEAA